MGLNFERERILRDLSGGELEILQSMGAVLSDKQRQTLADWRVAEATRERERLCREEAIRRAFVVTDQIETRRRAREAGAA